MDIEEASMTNRLCQESGEATAGVWPWPIALRGADSSPAPRVSGAPLAALAGGGLAHQFHAWRGRSGRRYVFSVFPIDARDVPEFEDAVVIAAAIERDGVRRILLLADTGT